MIIEIDSNRIQLCCNNIKSKLIYKLQIEKESENQKVKIRTISFETTKTVFHLFTINSKNLFLIPETPKFGN